MQTLHNIINAVNDVLWGYVLIYLLLAVGIYFTVRFGFVQFRALKRATQVTFAKPEDPNQISSFQAFATGLASRVGTGNIAGVATAISIGGPGAVFWMWVTAWLGMSLFVIFPFTRLVHVWSGFAAVGYLGRAWQLVRPRR